MNANTQLIAQSPERIIRVELKTEESPKSPKLKGAPIVLPKYGGKVSGTNGGDVFIGDVLGETVEVKAKGGYDKYEGQVAGRVIPFKRYSKVEGVPYSYYTAYYSSLENIENLRLTPGSSYVTARIKRNSPHFTEATLTGSSHNLLENYRKVALVNSSSNGIEGAERINLSGSKTLGNQIILKNGTTTTITGGLSGNRLEFQLDIPEEDLGKVKEVRLYFPEGLKKYESYFSNDGSGYYTSVRQFLLREDLSASIKRDTIEFSYRPGKNKQGKYALALKFKGATEPQLREFVSRLNPFIQIETQGSRSGKTLTPSAPTKRK